MANLQLLIFVIAAMTIPRGIVGLATYSGLTFELPDNEKMCFQEDFEGSQAFIMEYRVISGGNYDVDVSFETPTGRPTTRGGISLYISKVVLANIGYRPLL